jgi:Raf kinase inhibitor-like YbhB/YbcL family protein
MIQKICMLSLMILLIFSCQNGRQSELKAKGGETMEISSAAFEHEGMIPKKYTCDDMDISPPLAWHSIPDGAKSLALICDDPDAPMGTWVHWVVYDIPAKVEGFPEDMPSDEKLETGAKQGMTDFRSVGYGGPCPPSGTHRYYFKLYALDTVLNLEPGKTKEQLLKAMEGHILGESRLMGKYKRQ